MPFPSDLEIARKAHAQADLTTSPARWASAPICSSPTASTLRRSSWRPSRNWPTGRRPSTWWSPRSPPPRWARARPPPRSGSARRFSHIGKRATVAIRQPSMGPTFGIKGGAAGGGYSQVVPMEVLNLHLTGDFHAVTAAHNLLSAMVDNHLYQGNELGIDPHNITWRRVLDVNDRALRNIVDRAWAAGWTASRGRPGSTSPPPREVMAILALGHVAAGHARRGWAASWSATPQAASRSPPRSSAARASMAVIMRDAIKPNLMQTLENTPVLVHAGPFGNIAHGNSSVVADLIGIHARRLPGHRGRVRRRHGRGAVLQHQVPGVRASRPTRRWWCHRAGAEGALGTVQDRRRHGRCPRTLLGENPDDVHAGGGQPAQADREHPAARGVAGGGDQRVPRRPPVRARARSRRSPSRDGRRVAVCTHFADGGARGGRAGRGGRRGGRASPRDFRFLYPDARRCGRRSRRSRRKVYGADGVDYDLGRVRASSTTYERNGYGKLPVCIAKTHLSISSDPRSRGADRLAAAGAGGAGLGRGRVHLPDLRRHAHHARPVGAPAAARIDLDEEGEIVGLS